MTKSSWLTKCVRGKEKFIISALEINQIVWGGSVGLWNREINTSRFDKSRSNQI